MTPTRRQSHQRSLCLRAAKRWTSRSRGSFPTSNWKGLSRQAYHHGLPRALRYWQVTMTELAIKDDVVPGNVLFAATENDAGLEALEAEAIFIMREVAAEFERPALLFSGGKDSIVLLRLAEKAFWPAKFPFPVMHVDTGHN